MGVSLPGNVVDLPELRNKVSVFRDRQHAGNILAGMLKEYAESDAMIMAIPAGGVPVGKVLTEELHLPFDLAIVSKITLPWNTEIGYGAVAFDGTVGLNKALMAQIRISKQDIQKGIEETTAKVNRRVEKLRKKHPFPTISGQSMILVDDGIASGFTMLVAIEALQKSGVARIIVAVPTAHKESMDAIVSKVDAVFCPNVRSGFPYAVADAYEWWSDVDELEVMKILERVWKASS